MGKEEEEPRGATGRLARCSFTGELVGASAWGAPWPYSDFSSLAVDGGWPIVPSGSSGPFSLILLPLTG